MSERITQDIHRRALARKLSGVSVAQSVWMPCGAPRPLSRRGVGAGAGRRTGRSPASRACKRASCGRCGLAAFYGRSTGLGALLPTRRVRPCVSGHPLPCRTQQRAAIEVNRPIPPIARTGGPGNKSQAGSSRVVGQAQHRCGQLWPPTAPARPSQSPACCESLGRPVPASPS